MAEDATGAGLTTVGVYIELDGPTAPDGARRMCRVVSNAAGRLSMAPLDGSPLLALVDTLSAPQLDCVLTAFHCGAAPPRRRRHPRLLGVYLDLAGAPAPDGGRRMCLVARTGDGVMVLLPLTAGNFRVRVETVPTARIVEVLDSFYGSAPTDRDRAACPLDWERTG